MGKQVRYYPNENYRSLAILDEDVRCSGTNARRDPPCSATPVGNTEQSVLLTAQSPDKEGGDLNSLPAPLYNVFTTR